MTKRCNHDECTKQAVVDWGVCIDHYKSFVDEMKKEMDL